MKDAERLGGGTLPPWVHSEHRARWEFASRFVRGKSVADCACGVGWGPLTSLEAGARDVRAFDLSNDAIETARKRCHAYSNFSAGVADAVALPLDDTSVDVFISLETIEHLPDDAAFLEEVVRVLRPDGLFICSTPNRRVTMPGKQITDAPWNPFHLREYAEGEFEALLNRSFRAIAWYGQNPRRSWRTATMNALGSVLPGHMGGRLNSAMKLPRFVYDPAGSHAVLPIHDGFTYEYLVAVCRR